MKATLFRIVTGTAAAYHIVLAVAGVFSPPEIAAQIIRSAFGVELEVTPLIASVVRFAAVYMLAFGGMLLLLAWKPCEYRLLRIPVLGLFALRFVNRLIFFGTFTSLGLSFSRNVVGMGLILLFFVAILTLQPKSNGQAGE